MKKRVNSADIDNAIDEIRKTGNSINSEGQLQSYIKQYKLSIKLSYKKGIAIAALYIAENLMREAQYKEAKPYLEESIQILATLKHVEEAYFDAQLLQSEMYAVDGNIAEAIKTSENLAVTYNGKLSPQKLIKCYRNTAGYYFIDGRLYNAMYAYQKALLQKKELGHLRNYIVIWIFYAATLRDLKLFEQALEELLTIYTSTEFNTTDIPLRTVQTLHMNLASVYAEGFNDYENCKKHMDECISILKTANNTHLLDIAYVNQGINFTYLGRFTEALELFKKGNAENYAHHSPRERAELAINIANCLLQDGQWKDAEPYLTEAEKFITTYGLPLQRIGHYNNYFTYHTLAKNYYEAIRYHQLYKKAVDDNNQAEHNLHAQQLNALVDLERKQRELDVEKLQRKQAQREAEFTRQQNALMEASIEQRNKLIEEFQRAIKKMELSNTRQKDIFKELHEKINTVKRSNAQQVAYDIKFNSNHNEQVQKLQTLYSHITSSEAKIAIMLCQGLSNKEIASITLTTPRNIETQRFNLRKKLKLKTGQDLLEKLFDILNKHTG